MHIKLFEETRYRTPGLRNARVGRFLVETFFTKSPEFHFEDPQPYEAVESEDSNGYSIDIYFSDLNGNYFDCIVEMKNFLIENYNIKNSDTYIYHNVNSREDGQVILNITIKNSNSIEKIKKDARVHSAAKKYNL